MKQVFVLPADRRTPSGGNLYNRFLLKALRDAGVELSVMTIDAAKRDARNGPPARYWLDTLLLDRMEGLRALVRKPSECFVIVHHFPSLQPAAPMRSRARSRRIEDVAFRCADGFLLTSAFAARELACRDAGSKPFVVVPPAPAVAPSGEARPRPRGFRALMVANLVPGKGVLEFLQGFGRRLSCADEFSLQIAGRMDVDPAYAARCRRVVEASEALRHKVRFLGALGLGAMKRAYEGNAFFISASRMETFGMALNEARLFGLYVLALDAGNAATHVPSPSHGEILASISGLSERAAQLVANPALRRDILEAIGPPAAAPTWAQAAARFLEQIPMPQRRMARNIKPPRKLRGATRRPARSSRSRAAAQGRGMSPRGTKVQ
jgi:glycosyltransferase involved in cell wall biosynthesis